MFANVAKFAFVGVCELLSGLRIASPQSPVLRLTKLGTLPEAIRSASGEPLIVVSSMDWVWVMTDAIVVISSMTTCAGGLLPTTASKTTYGLSVLLLRGTPPVAR